MDKGIKGVLNHVKEYIKDVFLDKELLLRDLYFTKKHTDIEYFNQASILMQKQDVECVMSIKCWNQEFQKEVQSKKLERGIAVLIPTLQEETITLRPYRVFDIHQLDLSNEEKNNYLLEHRSHLSIVIRTSNIQEYLKICNGIRWQKEMLLSYLKTFIFFKKSTQELQNFYYQCLVATFNEELKITKQPIIEMINIKENECRRVYKNLHELISKLHFYFTDFIVEYTQKVKEEKEREAVYMDANKGIKKRIEEAKQSKYGHIDEDLMPDPRAFDPEYDESFDEEDNIPPFTQEDEELIKLSIKLQEDF